MVTVRLPVFRRRPREVHRLYLGLDPADILQAFGHLHRLTGIETDCRTNSLHLVKGVVYLNGVEMKQIFSVLLASLAVVYGRPQPQGVTDAIAPKDGYRNGCRSSFRGTFGITAVDADANVDIDAAADEAYDSPSKPHQGGKSSK